MPSVLRYFDFDGDFCTFARNHCGRYFVTQFRDVRNAESSGRKLSMTIRSIVTVWIIILVVVLAMAGCSTNDNAGSETSDSVADAADVIAAAVASGASSEGLFALIQDAGYLAGGSKGRATAFPGIPLYDTTLTRQRSGRYSYSYTFTINFTYGGSGDTADFNVNGNGLFVTPRMTGVDAITSTLKFADVQPPDTDYTVSGLYSRSGQFSLLVRSKMTLFSQIAITLTSLKVDKGTKRIHAGTASVTITSQGSGKYYFNYSATLVFRENFEATLTIASKTFIINLVTGETTPG